MGVLSCRGFSILSMPETSFNSVVILAKMGVYTTLRMSPRQLHQLGVMYLDTGL